MNSRMKYAFAVLGLMLVGADEPAGGRLTASGSLTTCLAPAADTSPVYPTTEFPAAVREVATVFRLGEEDRFEKLSARWIAVDVGEAAPPNFEIAATELSLRGNDRGTFRFSLPRDFPVGSYRIETVADGRIWKSVDFQVVADLPPVKLSAPEELYPLVVGQSAKYTFKMRPGPGLKINLPGVTRESDGTLRAEVTITTAGRDDQGVRQEFRRNDRLVFQEWMRWSDEGLVVTQRQPLEEVVPLDPPQPILRQPFGYRKWEHQSKDNAIRAAFRMWGPVPVQGPQGTAPGFVVLAEMPPDADGTEATAERHLLPGLGMVREVVTTARGGKRVTRQEMTRRHDE